MGILDRKDVGGVLPLLVLVSGYAAMERGSEWVEPEDLIKAIYVVDLEHVVSFWDAGESFEKVVTGSSGAYLNRTQYLLQVELMRRSGSNDDSVAWEFGKVSRALHEIVSAARRLAAARTGNQAPSSRDLLFSACSQNQELSRTLQAAGLNLAKLEASVRESK